MKMLSRVFTKCVVALTLCVIAGTSVAFGQLWMEETPQFPVYSNLIRQYKELKPTIAGTNMSQADRDRALAKMRELRSVAAQLKKNAESDPNGSEELKSRYTMFISDLDRNIARVEQTQPSQDPGPLPAGAALKLVANTTIFAPADDVEFRYLLPEALRGKVWVGLMKSSEPHRDLPYLDPSININPYQPKTLESRADGVFEYRAPQSGGMYDVRMFDKESGREITSERFRVEEDFVAELRAWKVELESARANLLEKRYGSKAIRGTYAAAFAEAGSTDPKYIPAWSDRFWVGHISQNRTSTAYVFYHGPIEMVKDSITNITIYKHPYSNEDVHHYRTQMRVWRDNHLKIYPLFEQEIRLDAERNRDLLDTYERLKTLSGSAREAEEKAAAKRSDARMPRYERIKSEYAKLKAQPIFAYPAGRVKKPA